MLVVRPAANGQGSGPTRIRVSQPLSLGASPWKSSLGKKVLSGGTVADRDHAQLVRRLAAILAADVVGYSRLMEADEDGTLARLRHLFRAVVQPGVSASRGRIFKLMGDAVLAEFPSGVDAVLCATALQQAVEGQAAGDPASARIRLRIGLHLGDVIAEGGDLLGDGVNLAARLEGLAEPGGIVISAAVAEAVRGRLPFTLEDLGDQSLKNIARPVRAFRIGAAATDAPSGAAAPPTLALPDKPSLVVLPFQNMSGDAEQDYFVDGLVEDITTALSCIRSLFVIARNSAFTYKGRAVDVRQVGRELGVATCWRAACAVPAAASAMTGQLIEAASGAHLWADRFDGALDDVFDLQDQVTVRIASTIFNATLQEKRRSGDLRHAATCRRRMTSICAHCRSSSACGERGSRWRWTC